MSTIYQRQGKGSYYYESSGRTPRSMRTDNLIIAQKLQAEWDEEMEYSANGLVNPNKKWGPFRDQYFKSYEGANAYLSFMKLQNVVREFERSLGISNGERPLVSITQQECEMWQSGRLQKVAPSTVRGERSYLAPMFAYAHRNGFIKRDPFYKMMDFNYVKKKAKALTYDQAQKFLVTMHERQPEYDLLALFAYETGMRLDEIIHQRMEYVDFDGKILRVSEHVAGCPCVQCARWEKLTGKRVWVPKTRKERGVPLSEAVLAGLMVIRSATPHGVIFPMGRSTIGNLFDRIHKKAGTPGKARVHIFRHTLITDMGRAGVRRAVVMDIVGHANLSAEDRATQTDDYDHTEDWELHDGLKKLLAWREAQKIKLQSQVVDGLRVISAA